MNLSRASIEMRARVFRARKAGTATVLPAVFDPAIGPPIGRWAPRNGFGARPAGTACGARREILTLWLTAQPPSYACLGSV
jgi:hypothetical protein